MLKIQKYMTRS